MKFFALAALAALLPGHAAAAALAPAQIARIDRIVERAMAQQHLSGVEIGVGRNGHLLFARGYGLRDRAHALPATPATVFAIGSITKSFTATAVMMLVERGAVRLDAPVARYVPAAPHAGDVTVRELLDQTSGIPDYLTDPAIYHEILTSTIPAHPMAWYVARVAHARLLFPPGSRWMYSNTNYAILGMLVEKVAGEPYAAFIRERIFAPLGLDSTQVMTSTPPRGNDSADGYTYVKGRYEPVAPQSMSWANAAGAIASDAHDLVAFDGALFSRRLVSAASLHAMLTPPPDRPMVAAHDPQRALAGGYGFAWVTGHDGGRTIEWHNGGLIGGRAMNAVYPQDGLEIVVLTNVTTAMPEEVALRIARVLHGG